MPSRLDSIQGGERQRNMCVWERERERWQETVGNYIA